MYHIGEFRLTKHFVNGKGFKDQLHIYSNALETSRFANRTTETFKMDRSSEEK